MAQKSIQKLTPKKIEKLLNQQTAVILSAVDEKLAKQQKYVDYRISVLEKRLEKMEIRINQKIDRLTTTLDKFLKRITDLEDEFELMKADLKRVKSVLKEKLGVTLD
jgi:hypothetical protein